jgi:hypothetical protein
VLSSSPRAERVALGRAPPVLAALRAGPPLRVYVCAAGEQIAEQRELRLRRRGLIDPQLRGIPRLGLHRVYRCGEGGAPGRHAGRARARGTCRAPKLGQLSLEYRDLLQGEIQPDTQLQRIKPLARLVHTSIIARRTPRVAPACRPDRVAVYRSPARSSRSIRLGLR